MPFELCKIKYTYYKDIHVYKSEIDSTQYASLLLVPLLG